jgi:hypothetical protein
MYRYIYVAGVHRKHLAAAESIPYCLHAVTLLRENPNWLDVYLQRRTVIWDLGTSSKDTVAYHRYRAYLDQYACSQDETLL